ncbi:class I SAM-dependent methyltransferase [Pseudofulvibacter geojedonensis]|uniref:Class I SAM-dependent methyltransferase n=1 Tax=Pseudofulvibacter geojedonensis TaxID=1123758 RepID=A0ABW3I0Q9_9FLAO
MKDILGTALLDYYNNNYSEDIITESTISEADEMPLPYLFRSYKEMPVIEQKALQLAKGKVLDVGCGAGSHSLYLQNVKNLDVTAIDISIGATEVTKARGIKNCFNQNLFEQKDQYDTLLLLMNGIGICGKLERINLFLQHLKSLLKPNGQILLDSSDIIYMFDQEEDGSVLVQANKYYGEVEFTMSYKGEASATFDWLYLDYNTLQNACMANNLNCELVTEGDHYDFLARITRL